MRHSKYLMVCALDQRSLKLVEGGRGGSLASQGACRTDTETQINELANALKSIGNACRRYAELAGLEKFKEPDNNAFFRGQSRVHCEYDAIYLKIEDLTLGVYLSGLPEFQGSWRNMNVVRVFEQL